MPIFVFVKLTPCIDPSMLLLSFCAPSLVAAKSPWKQSNAWASVRLALLGTKNPLEVLSTSIYVFFDFYSV